MDNFKDYINEHRSQMDIEKPSDILLSKILEKTKIVKKPIKIEGDNKRWLYFVIGMAASLIPAIMIYWQSHEKPVKSEDPVIMAHPAPTLNSEANQANLPETTHDGSETEHVVTYKYTKKMGQKKLVPSTLNSIFYQQASDQTSAASRYNAVMKAKNVQHIDKEIVNILIKTLNEDQSINVRYAALGALEKFVTEDKVKKALIASLSKQTDPTIQIALINILTEARATAIEDELNRLYNAAETEMLLKHEILLAKQKLSL